MNAGLRTVLNSSMEQATYSVLGAYCALCVRFALRAERESLTGGEVGGEVGGLKVSSAFKADLNSSMEQATYSVLGAYCALCVRCG